MATSKGKTIKGNDDATAASSVMSDPNDLFASDSDMAGGDDNGMVLGGDGGSMSTGSPFVIDFGAVKEYTPAKPGLYNCTIVKAEPRVAASSGNPMIACRWRVNDEHGDDAGKVVYDNLVFAENSLWHVKQVLAALGYPENYRGGVDPEALIGEQATLELTVVPIKKNGSTVDPTTGEAYGMQNNIKRVLPAGSAKTVDSIL